MMTVLKTENMRLIRIYLLMFGLVSLFGNLKAQDKWSLNECINYALEHNLTHQGLELVEQSARIDAQQSKFNLLPSISASSSAGVNFGRTVDDYSSTVTNTQNFSNSNSLSASFTLFRGFILKNQIAYAKYRREVAEWKKVNHEDDLAFNILMAYFNMIYYQGVVEISREQLNLSEYNLEKTQMLVKTGLKAKSDLAEMQANYEKEKLNLIQSENKQEETRLVLGQAMNLPANRLDRFEVDTGESVIAGDLSVDSDSLFSFYVENSPYVKIAEAELQAAAKEVAIARGQFLPSIYLNGSVSTGYYETYKNDQGVVIPFADQIENNMGQYLGASLSIPVFQKNQRRNQFRQAKLAKEQAQVELDSYIQKVYYELHNNVRELRALFREYIQTEKQVDAERLAFKVAQRKYDEGLINVIELLTVKNRMAEAKGQLLFAKLQWEIKNKTLDFYKGIRFWE